MVKAAVFGYGTVGSGIVEVIMTNRQLITDRTGEDVDIKYILDLRDFPGDPYETKIVHDVETILNDPEITVIAEAMGGIEPAYTFTKRALSAGKSVCTSNKELVEKHGAELCTLAKENSCNYLFEASVGGGIPLLRTIVTSLTADHIDAVTGILNGTTNYILTKMAREGSEFDTVLKEAQEKGYAERNPEADVEGHDAGRKITILASLVTGKNADYEDVYTEGITGITTADFAYAKAMGRVIRLLGIYRELDGKYFAYVAPAMIDDQNPLYSVSDVFNGVLVHGNMVGDTMFYGAGAGKLPTASAVAGDVVDCVRAGKKTLPGGWSMEKLPLTDHKALEKSFFIRVTDDKVSEVEKIFGQCRQVDAGIAGEKGFLTGRMDENTFEEKAGQLGGYISRIRVED
ncbi:MAG: homoserine dehydrogenase [Lachnospiraceae bacterium]|nr:homoserine dehydrogenase [Lachnospiraceae bacterium]